MDVGVADAAEQDFDDDVVWLRLAPLDGHGGERFTGCWYAPGGYLLHLVAPGWRQPATESRIGRQSPRRNPRELDGLLRTPSQCFLVRQWPRFLRVSLRAARRHSTNARSAG